MWSFLNEIAMYALLHIIVITRTRVEIVFNFSERVRNVKIVIKILSFSRHGDYSD